MEHTRHYSLEEASALLEPVTELLGRMRSARDRLGDAEARAALAAASGTNGGGQPGRTVSEGFLELRDGMIWLRERELVLRDLDRGLLDFPAMRDGVEIYLCWEEGEEEIGWWHEPEAGFAGRRALDDV
ncbi:MAG TPA: DUF2203 family protein [Thermoleophilaceae bacterium]|jgi:hypothetical protein|nr:DUF2203 family protein [Thermoleophilaceae bacterium]